MGWKIKLILIIVTVLVALNIFMPDRANDAMDLISENTGISKEKIEDGVNLATDIAKDGADMAKDKASEVVDDVKDKISE